MFISYFCRLGDKLSTHQLPYNSECFQENDETVAMAFNLNRNKNTMHALTNSDVAMRIDTTFY